jgi:membrane-bound ClpP family serine protease
MAPGTNLGAATPVQIGGPLPGLPGSAPDKDGKDKKDDAQHPALKDAMTAKATNDAVALIRSLAELRGRNADWAEKAVREAASLSASGALQANVIDLVARNPTELLQLIVGLTVVVLGSLWRARRNPARVGGQAACRSSRLVRQRRSRLHSWRALAGHGVEALTPGETVEVAGIKDLTLVVRRRSARTVSEGGV